ncbi:hypothetical protein K8I31_08200 [bacterium]|nr:hypothetical protein [bacterium]
MLVENKCTQNENQTEDEKPQNPFEKSAHESLVMLPIFIMGMINFPKIYPNIAHIHPLFFYIPCFIFCLVHMMNGCAPKEKRFLSKVASLLLVPFTQIFFMMSAYYFMSFVHWPGFEMWKRMLFHQ